MQQTKDFSDLHANKLAQMKETLLGSSINEQLQLKAINNQKLNRISDSISQVTGKPVWEEFSFRSGKVLGILRAIAQNPKHRQELLAVTGLTQDYIDLYFDVCGNLPFVNSTDNTVNYGQPMVVDAAKQLVQLTANQLGVVYEDFDVRDFTEDRWNRLYNAALERAMETVKFNEQNAAMPVVYEE